MAWTIFSRNFGLIATYAACAFVCALGLVDHAFGGLLGFVMLGVLGLGCAFVAHLLNLAFQWRTIGFRGLIPLATCLAVIPTIWILGPPLLRARFHWNREKYEALAEAVRNGSHHLSLEGDHALLGHWVDATRFRELDDGDEWADQHDACVPGAAGHPDADRVVAVHFLTVTHGYAGHVGFMRAFHPVAERCLDRGHGLDGWRTSTAVAGHWYLVVD